MMTAKAFRFAIDKCILYGIGNKKHGLFKMY